jgi:hypothetical protein
MPEPNTQPQDSFANVDLIQEFAPPPAPDEKAKAEGQVFERGRDELLLKELEYEIEARRTFASRLFKLMIGWLVCMVLLVVGDAGRWPWASRFVGFDLSDSVLITLITTTTGTVVGIFLIVAKYLYRIRDRESP